MSFTLSDVQSKVDDIARVAGIQYNKERSYNALAKYAYAAVSGDATQSDKMINIGLMQLVIAEMANMNGLTLQECYTGGVRHIDRQLKNSTDLRITQGMIGEWAKSVEAFKDSTPRSCCNHIVDEVVNELAPLVDEYMMLVDKELTPGNELRNNIAVEAADAVILLCDLANKLGFDLALSVSTKMHINRARQYGQINDGGFYEHIKGEGEDE